jgi:signal transduction histidine kinase/CheY-like chemotaxis protein
LILLLNNAEHKKNEVKLRGQGAGLGEYESLMDSIYLVLDTLESTANDNELAMLGEVRELLAEKKTLLVGFIFNKMDAEAFDAYAKVIEQANEEEVEEDNPLAEAHVTEEVDQQEPELIGPPMKPGTKTAPPDASLPGIFRKYRQRMEDQYTAIKTGQEKEDVVKLNSLKRILTKVKTDQQASLQKLTLQELVMLQKNSQVTEKIRTIISQLEVEESMNETKAQQAVQGEITNAIALLLPLSISAIALSVLFVGLIFRDIARSSLYRKELILDKEKAEGIARAKEVFLANMSHEIRTPLTAITGYAEQLKLSGLSVEQNQWLDHVLTSSEHLLQTVNEILDYSKLEAGMVALEKVPFSTDEVTREVVALMHPKALQKGIGLSVHGEGQWVVGDPFRLRQILLNLVSNAIKFTDEGFVELEIEHEVQDLETKAIFRVHDTGIGIPVDKQEEIFENFQQADPSTTRKYGGTGLGLAICKKLVEWHGGNIGVESQPGEGATFTVTIPYVLADEALPTSKVPLAVAKNVLNGKVILVVDDDQLNRDLCRLILEKHGATVHALHDPRECLPLLESLSVDLIMTDRQMPFMDGLALAQAIRKLPAYASTPVVLFTANTTGLEGEAYKNLGITAHLLKPFRESELLELAGKLLGFSEEGIAEVMPATALPFAMYFDKDEATQYAVVTSFASQVRREAEELATALSQDDDSRVRQIAHKLSNGFGLFGFEKACAMVRELETGHTGLEDARGHLARELLHAIEKDIIPSLERQARQLMVRPKT